jgi:hypothetical protein
MPWGEASKGEVARRLGPKEDQGEGVTGVDVRFNGEGALRWRLGGFGGSIDERGAGIWFCASSGVGSML